jgi:shikimate dehydrogenase
MNPWFEWRDAPKATYAVVGDPIGHSFSPMMHQAWLDSQGIKAKYVAIRVAVEEFDVAMDHLVALGYEGVNVTVPNKTAAFEWCAHVDELSELIGAVNTLDLRNKRGTNTDAPGFLATLPDETSETPEFCLILGAGGAARSVYVALSKHRHYAISLWARNKGWYGKAAISNFDFRLIPEPTVGRFNLIINCTPGISPIDLNLDWSQADPNCLAYDLMIGVETPFLAGARAAGLKTMDGLEMLIEQGALAMEFWARRRVDRSVYRIALSGGQR